MRILAIETSCDETSASVVEKNISNAYPTVVSSVVSSSVSLHGASGGIIPEKAAREQVKWIMPIIAQSLLQSEKGKLTDSKTNYAQAQKILKQKIDAIAVTIGPGLVGSLLVGTETARTLSYVCNKPIIPVNHLLGHLYANFLETKLTTGDYRLSTIDFPFIALIVSGGHTDLLLFKNHHRYQWLGGTRDDAAGEALDQIGRT